jgi:pimeloyl-ACP methyl ester carboxylesterase
MLLALGSGKLAFAAKQSDRSPSTTIGKGASMIESGDGTRIHCRDWGSGRAIVFLAPWALCSDWWDIPVMNLVERGWRCVTLDRRGHARSDDPCHGYDFDTLSDDIAAVMDTLDLKEVVLVGHSMGGAEVVRYLTRHGSRRVSHAVLIAAPTPFGMKTEDNPNGKSRERLAQIYQLFRHDFPRVVAEAAPDFFGVSKNSISKETMEWWCRMILDRCSSKALLDLFKVMNETDFRPELRTIRTPTLILQGDIDKSASLELNSGPTHELIAGSRLIVYENAPHGLPYTHTDRMLQDIIAFADPGARTQS